MAASEAPSILRWAATPADQQASLGRVAALAAGGAEPAELFAATAREVACLLAPRLVQVFRWERDGTATVVGTWGEEPNPFPVGSNWSCDEPAVTALADRLRGGSTVGLHDAGAAHELGIAAAAAAPIVVDGEPWGLIGVGTAPGAAVPDQVEERLADFARLVATMLSSRAAREQQLRLAQEQAALRRVATLVARGAPPAEVLDAVAAEVGQLLGVDSAGLVRIEPDETVTLVAAWGLLTEQVPVGTRLPLGGRNVTTEAARTGRPARYDRSVRATGPLGEHARGLGVRDAAAIPIMVTDRIWGVMTVAAAERGALPDDAEPRLGHFTELAATAIANAEARAELQLHADEQAALRRVATLVAQGVPARELLTAVAREIAVQAELDLVHMYRYEPGEALLVAASTLLPVKLPLGTRHALEGENIPTLVHRTGRPARMDDMTRVTGTPAAIVDRLALRSVIGCPIIVEGRLWGVVIAATAQEDRIPADTEERIGRFTELVATAIANADSRAQLEASRARVVAAATEERREIVRDLHDGAQQRLVHAAITLKLALRELERGDSREAEVLVREALGHTDAANSELRELAHGIMPSVLTVGGLRAGVEALAGRSSLPVTVDVGPERYPSHIEATGYFVVSEALTNVVKHACADRAEVTTGVERGCFRLEVRDDGVGGADPAHGSGLTGLRDRVEALGGTIEIASPVGGGTSLVARIPLDDGR